MTKDSGILVVDDDTLSLELCKLAFKVKGYTCVYVAESYYEALDILKDRVISLVLTDIMMPEVTGAQLALYIRENYPDIHIMFMSASSDILSGSKREDIICYKKPIKIDTLIPELNSLLEGEPDEH